MTAGGVAVADVVAGQGGQVLEQAAEAAQGVSLVSVWREALVRPGWSGSRDGDGVVPDRWVFVGGRSARPRPGVGAR